MRHRKAVGAVIASIAAVVAVFVAGAGPAAAAKTIQPKITIRYTANDDYLSGWVKSSNEGCNVARYPLRVFRKRPGKDQLFQKLGTYDDGYWRVDGPIPDGTYYAKLKKYEFDSVICEKAQSPEIKVPG